MTKEEFQFDKGKALANTLKNTAEAIIKNLNSDLSFPEKEIQQVLILKIGRSQLIQILMQPMLLHENTL